MIAGDKDRREEEKGENEVRKGRKRGIGNMKKILKV